MQVKQHPYFRDINWDTLARQKVHSTSIHYTYLHTKLEMAIFPYLAPVGLGMIVVDSDKRWQFVTHLRMIASSGLFSILKQVNGSNGLNGYKVMHYL